MWWPVGVQILYQVAESDGFAGAFADSIIYGHRHLGEECRARDRLEKFTCFRVVFGDGRLGQLGFPQDDPFRHAESCEDAGEIVGAPAVTQYER